METKTHLQKKFVQHYTTTPVENEVVPRGINVQPQVETAFSQDSQTAAQLGHQFADISITSGMQSVALPIQPKLTIGKAENKYSDIWW